MDARIVWQNGMSFETQIRTHRFIQDAKLEHGGKDLGPTPKELLLASVIGCTGMDVVSLMTKMRAGFTACEVEAQAETLKTHPQIFDHIDVHFKVTGGAELKNDVIVKAVKMSLTKYCGVSAMVDATSPIKFKIFANGQLIESGEADFSEAMAAGSP